MALFDIEEIWRRNPLEAFADFVKSEEFVRLGRRPDQIELAIGELREITDRSAAVYLAMFARFARWMRERDVTIFEVSSHDVYQFLQEPKEKRGGELVSGTENGQPLRLNSKIRLVYIRLLERVCAHLKITPNPVSKAVLDKINALSKGRNAPKSYLDEDEAALFMANLPQATPFNPTLPPGTSWKRRRDRAMQAMMLGAGLKVSEVVRIETASVGRVDTTGSAPVTVHEWESDGSSIHHRPQIRPFAVKEVMSWIKERKHLAIPGHLLFPKSLTDGRPLNKATVFRSVRKTFDRAGIEVMRRGGRTLRNTFAIRELEVGSLEHVGELLGHRANRSTRRYLPYTEKVKRKRTGKSTLVDQDKVSMAEEID